MTSINRASTLFLVLTLIGFGLRFGYGVARYRTDLVRVTGSEFIAKWDYDGLEHVLIAKALLSGKGYIVDEVPGLESKHVRLVGREALYKAPLYEFFLAGLFKLSGFSFLLFFPAQALFGGLLCGFVGLITLETFERPTAAYFAGVMAAAHPVLVNSASQPYNENLFFLLFVATLWAFYRWLDTQRMSWAVVSGMLAALWILTRESAIPLFMAMLMFAIVTARRNARFYWSLSAIVVVAIGLIAPWSVRNYVQFGVVVPVASITGSALLEGNNDCVARESLLTPFLAQPCADTNRKVKELLDQHAFSERLRAYWYDRAARVVAVRFIVDHPAAYLKLSVRRTWTIVLPYNPRADQQPLQRAAFAAYWLAIMPAGIISMFIQLRRPRQQTAMIVLLIAVNLATMAAVLIHQDLRFRVGLDLLLGCFAGWGYSAALKRIAARRRGRNRHESLLSPRSAAAGD